KQKDQNMLLQTNKNHSKQAWKKDNRLNSFAEKDFKKLRSVMREILACSRLSECRALSFPRLPFLLDSSSLAVNLLWDRIISSLVCSLPPLFPSCTKSVLGFPPLYPSSR